VTLWYRYALIAAAAERHVKLVAHGTTTRHETAALRITVGTERYVTPTATDDADGQNPRRAGTARRVVN
jgi:imidazolonepropionase-like amidohydrolase